MPLEFVGHGISIPVAGWDDLVLGRFHPWIDIPGGRLILESHAEAVADIAPTERAADREGEAAFDRMAEARRPTSPSSAEPPVNAKTGAPLSPLSDGHSLRLRDPPFADGVMSRISQIEADLGGLAVFDLGRRWHRYLGRFR